MLSAIASDDGIPRTAPAPNGRPPGRYSSKGLRVAWIHYRGPGNVIFEPEQFKVFEDPHGNSPWTPGWQPPPLGPGGESNVSVRFASPGEYTLRVLAHDGFLASSADVIINVK
jgi:hypothetical protein